MRRKRGVFQDFVFRPSLVDWRCECRLIVGDMLAYHIMPACVRCFSVSETEVVCKSSQYDRNFSRSENGDVGNGSVEVAVDGVPVSAADAYRFAYTDDPIIISVQPTVSFIR